MLAWARKAVNMFRDKTSHYGRCLNIIADLGQQQELVMANHTTSEPFDLITSPNNTHGPYFNHPSALRLDDSDEEYRADFVSFISLVSMVYHQRKYLSFSVLDLNQHQRNTKPLNRGSVYVVRSATVRYEVPSFNQFGHLETRTGHVVTKEIGRLFDWRGRVVDQQKLRSLMNETRILTHNYLYWHANIINFVGVAWYMDETSWSPHVVAQPRIVLEQADQTLDGFLDMYAEIPFRTRLCLCLDVANGLAALHKCGIIHGDVKPANVLLFQAPSLDPGMSTDRYSAKLADFSHSFHEASNKTHYTGTPGYMAPEIVQRRRITDCKATDNYSAGVTFLRTIVSEASLPVTTADNSESINHSDIDTALQAILRQVDVPVQRSANERRLPLLISLFSNLRSSPSILGRGPK
ncbi:kinase-like domain-containing protein [Aspergillus heterothallicus]